MSEIISFGTDGWRAVIAEHFTFANVERVAYATAIYIRNAYHGHASETNGSKPMPLVPLLIGYDTRFLADRFARHAAQLLIGMGIPVKLSDRDVPTPCIAWATQHEPTAGALQFTASHNPPEYCGIKYIPHFAGPATNDITASIVSHLNDIPDGYEVKPCAVPTFDPKPPYLEALKKLVDMERIRAAKLKVCHEALYSTCRGYLDQVLKDAGLDVTVLHDWRDPLFGGGMPEPKKQYLTELINEVKKGKYAIGVTTDGDADRFAAVDEKGDYLSPNQLLCLITRHLVKNRKQKGAIVRTVATTHLLDRLAELYGLPVVETPVGFKYVGEEMRVRDVLIGGEESGGVSVKGHIPEKDGIAGNLFLIEMLAMEGKPLSQIWKDLLAEAGGAGMTFVYKRADLSLTMRTQKALMDRLCDQPLTTLAGEAVVKVGRSDGLKLYLDHNNWVLIRPSGTEPLVRLYFEGVSEEKVDRVMADFNEQIDRLLKEIEAAHPENARVETGRCH